MDYKKLTEATLDEIMKQIRARNNTVKPEVVSSVSHEEPATNVCTAGCPVEVDADMAVVEQHLVEAVVGREIGVNKSPMYKQHGIKLKIARFIEKVYLRVAELSNRHIRIFNSLILSAVTVLKEKIKILFRNDAILWENMEKLTTEKNALAEEIKQLKASVEDKNNHLEKKLQDASQENVTLQLKLEQQAAETNQMGNQLSAVLQESLVQSLEEKLGQYESEAKAALNQTESRLYDQVHAVSGIVTQIQEHCGDVAAHVEENRVTTEDIRAQLQESCSLTEKLENRIEENRATTEDIRAQLQESCSLTEKLENRIEENRATTEDIRAQLQESRDAAAAFEASFQEKTAALVDQLNRQVLKIRDLEEKISAASAKMKWINDGAYEMGYGDGSAASSVLSDPAFYHDFEERFRGTQEDIRERLAHYLPILLKHFGNLENKRFVDIGCGRGEWLDLIAANGAKDYVGIDLNSVQIEICKQKGHPAVTQNCMEYLANLSDESVDMISGIQLIEHLSLDNLLALLAECRRVLRPQGMILFETPNTSNLITASNWFYIDPTHNHPIHKEFARFLAERSGYTDVEILEVNPTKYVKTLVNPICLDGNQVVWDENIETLNNLLYGPQDYAIVGVKGNE